MDRFVPLGPDLGKPDDGAKQQVILEAARLPVPRGYSEAFALRRWLFDDLVTRGVATTATATVRGRLAVGLGARGVLESGLRLDHTWGTPVLPGSALKGLAAAAAHQLVEAEGNQWRKPKGWPRSKRSEDPISFELLFGTTDDSGAVAFHDAWWYPESSSPLLPDVMTVHHPDYYQQSAGDCAPSDMDKPTPIPFVAIRGAFLVVLEGDTPWRDAAYQLLEHGLLELGLGAKTSSGYGRLLLERCRSPAEEFERALEAIPRHGGKWEVKQALQPVIEELGPGQLSKFHVDSLVRLRNSMEDSLVSALERDWPEVKPYWRPSRITATTKEPEWQRLYAWVKGSQKKAELILREERAPTSRKILEKKLKRLDGEVLETAQMLPKTSEATPVDVILDSGKLVRLRVAK